ncbi:MAG: saccharopine dehydrogenase family protein [Vampirovibrionia bacterium]
MRYLVLGAGLMGYACVFDLVNSVDVTKVTVIDINDNNLAKIKNTIKSDKLSSCRLNISDSKALSLLMKDHNTVISMISYKYNYNLAKMAIESGCNFCDLGGNNDIVDKQYTLNDLAIKNNVAVIPDCGLAPGLAGNIAFWVARKFDQANDVKIRVGGLPIKPEPPMNYSIFFSGEGLINEYYEKPILLRDGHIEEGEPLGDLEYLDFDNFPQLEAFNTSGGISTLPKTIS